MIKFLHINNSIQTKNFNRDDNFNKSLLNFIRYSYTNRTLKEQLSDCLFPLTIFASSSKRRHPHFPEIP